MYSLFYDETVWLAFRLHDHLRRTIGSSALLSPGYAFVVAVAYAYKGDARTRLEGLAIERALARVCGPERLVLAGTDVS